MTSVALGQTGPGLDSFTSWYRERPTQLAFAVSLLLHALLIAFIPGFRSVPLETPSVLTVRIVENEIVAERPPQPKPVVQEQAVAERLQPPEPVAPPEFLPTVPQPRVVEQDPVRPRQIVEPQPAPSLPRTDQPLVQPVDRPQLAPAVPRQRAQLQPEVLTRPKLTPDQPLAPVVRQEPAPQLDAPPQQIAEVRRQPRVVRQEPVEVQRPDVAPPVTQPVRIEQPRVEPIEAPPEQIVEVRREPRDVTAAAVRPQPRPDVAPPVASPIRIEQPAAAQAPARPVPAQPPSVERSAPQVAAAPAPPASVAKRPSVAVPSAAPVVAAPAPPVPSVASKPAAEAVEPSVLEAYRHSVSQEVMKHMSYPRVAVRRKWEGKTVVEMQLSVDGDVTGLSVAESSGKDILDEAAVAMVKRALPLPKPPPGVRSVRVPVVFRLQG